MDRLTGSEYALQTILAGNHDAYITKWAQDAAAWGQSCQTKKQLPAPCPMYLRFAHEMNGTWYPWSPNVNGNSTTDFINAWRYIHDKFKAAGATNVRWVWSPYIECGNCTPFSQVYPGDAYVDWVGLDGFNWGTTQSWSSWQSMAQVFGSSYDKVTALAPSKPFMIAETASAEAGDGGTKKVEWITNAFNTDIPNRLPTTQAVMWFSADKTQQGETDWRVNSSAPSLKAYQDVAKSAAWQGQLPPGGYDPPSTTPPPADTTAPTVSNVSPSDGATSIALDTNVMATFSEDMDPAALNTSTFTLYEAGTTQPAIPATVTYDAVTMRVTLDPTEDLQAGTTYTATVTTGAKDKAGNALLADKVWSFTTASESAPAAPTNLTAVRGGSGSKQEIILTWIDNSNNETGFRVERSTDKATWSQVAAPAANATSYTDVGPLRPKTTYYYRVKATNSVGSSPWCCEPPASATTK